MCACACMRVCVHEKLQSVQRALDSSAVDNKRLAQSMERAVLTNSSLHRKLEQARDQHQATITLRYTVNNSLVWQSGWTCVSETSYMACINEPFACLSLYIAETKSCVRLRKRSVICLKSWTLFSNRVRETANPPEESQRYQMAEMFHSVLLIYLCFEKSLCTYNIFHGEWLHLVKIKPYPRLRLEWKDLQKVTKNNSMLLRDLLKCVNMYWYASLLKIRDARYIYWAAEWPAR